VVTPNSDPRYSFLIVDLRTEPLVVMRATPDNQLVLVPNSQAWGKVITNMASETRRVDLVFGVS
jgi:small-conductance mechanosensitive channel